MCCKIKTKDLNCGLKSVEYIDIKDLYKSIKEVGILNPLRIDENNNIIDGNYRCYAALVLEVEEVPVVFVGDVSLKNMFLRGILDGLENIINKEVKLC